MAANVNSVVLIGSLTRDPELRHTRSGAAVCNLWLTVNNSWKDRATGESSDQPQHFKIRAWNRLAENCAQYLSKGQPAAVSGRLTWQEWEAQDGTKRESVVVEASTVQFLPVEENGGGAARGDFAPATDRYTPATATSSPANGFHQSDDGDGIPF